ncbi:hypothetical protein DL766_008241 [Monosporascus sp. MC13-8B]|nr:hypothetical protein DL766_008241 [Monosporascus sp. MC13-8B]
MQRPSSNGVFLRATEAPKTLIFPPPPHIIDLIYKDSTQELVFPETSSPVVLAAYDARPTSLLVPGPRFGTVAPSTHHHAEQSSSSYVVNSGYTIDKFRLPLTKREKLSLTGQVLNSAKSNLLKHHCSAQPGDMITSNAVPIKSRRVRTGCLTCRERHLKCDEGTPNCNHCRKSNRECKRGVRLNFIDTICKEPPFVVSPEGWSVVAFEDESRLIASEYQGGLERYPKIARSAAAPSGRSHAESALRRQTHAPENASSQMGVASEPTSAMQTLRSLYYGDTGQAHAELTSDSKYRSRKSSITSFMGATPGSSNGAEYGHILAGLFTSTRDDSGRPASHHKYKGSDASTTASIAGATPVGPPSTFRGGLGGNSQEIGPETGMITPPNERTGEREYLNSPEELRFMQVFVSEVGIWMDSLDRDKHFSRMLPYRALKCPMLLNALLACGVKHLILKEQHNDKSLFYYDTATTQLLRSLQNPDRNTAECAATAVVLNVYEIMSEKPTQRMSHIAGARALIRECGWSAKSGGLGAACFWLNVSMELLSCLAFNWQTAWDPDHWGLDMDFLSFPTLGNNNSNSKGAECDDDGAGGDIGNEEVWVHRILYIVAKIANFRASIPKSQEPSPHDDQIRLQARYVEWQRLKNMCDSWDSAVPRPMHPFGYVYPSQTRGKSLFPNVWLIKRAAIVGRLYYHMAQCLLAQINPVSPRGTADMRTAQLHHAHQVCGIVAHTEDRGVASVSIRSLAIVAEVLTDLCERQEVVAILEKVDRETGWRLAGVLSNLKRVWDGRRWDRSGWRRISRRALAVVGTTAAAQTTSPIQTQPQQQSRMPRVQAQKQPAAVTAPRPLRVNPLSFADFSLPNHPYQNWYEPPSRSNSYNSHGFL